MKIETTRIKGSTLSIICSGRFGIGSEGNSSATLIQNEIESAISKYGHEIKVIEIDFLNVEYKWGDGPISAIASVLKSGLKIKYIANDQNVRSLSDLVHQSGFQNLFQIEVVSV